MKKLTLLTALLCASLFSFAEPSFTDSEYCGEVMLQGDNREAAFTWETNSVGVITITITETLGGAPEDTHFRGNGINIDKIKVGEEREDAANYFDLTCGGSSNITLTPKEGSSLDLGTKIYVENQIIEYATSKDTNAWPTLTFVYTYGGVCTVAPVLTRLSLKASANWAKPGEDIELTATGTDQMGKPMAVAVNYTINPTDAGVIEGNVYKPAKIGGATITATAGTLSATIKLYGTDGINLATNQPSEAGYNPENQNEQAKAANDEDLGSAWVTWVDRPAAEEWWMVDLGKAYKLLGIELLWGNDYAKEYILQGRSADPTVDDKANDEAWTTLAEVNDGVKANAAVFSGATGEYRFVRMHALKRSANCIRLRDVRVFALPNEEVGTSIQNANVAQPVQKVLRNGQILILRDGEMYNLQGSLVR